MHMFLFYILNVQKEFFTIFAIDLNVTLSYIFLPQNNSCKKINKRFY